MHARVEQVQRSCPLFADGGAGYAARALNENLFDHCRRDDVPEVKGDV